MKNIFMMLAAILCLSGGTAVLAAPAASDAEVLSLIMAVDQNEIKAAKVATEKNISSEVKNYAEMLNKEHSMNLDESMVIAQKANIERVDSDVVKQVRKDGEQDLASIKDLDSDQFSKAYVTAMVKGHTEALDMLDKYKPEIQDEAVKKHVAETREHVANHLKEAKKLQTNMESGNPTQSQQ
jgi:putative membrane protein